MADPPIDLRSDTVTRPTPGMRAAMHAAEVGDVLANEVLAAAHPGAPAIDAGHEHRAVCHARALPAF